MAIKTITRGLAGISFAPVATDGGAGTLFNLIGNTDKDSPVTLVEDQPTFHHVRNHEKGSIMHTAVEKGDTQLVFSLVDVDMATMSELFGATVAGEGDAATLSFPTDKITIERTVKIEPKIGFITTIARGLVTAVINGDFAVAGKMAIDVTVMVMEPTKAGVSPLVMSVKTVA